MKHYTLIGNPLGHSMSPMIHERLFALKGREADYTLTAIPPEKLCVQSPNLKELAGFNITIPHKMAIIPFLDGLDDTAKRYNSVNTVATIKGKSIGYNTDCTGFLHCVSDFPLSGKVLLIGCGGVGRMMAIEVLSKGAELTIAILEGDRPLANALLEEIDERYPQASVHVVLNGEIEGNFDVLLNATPVGMYPKTLSCPVSDEVIAHADCFFDAIYNPTQTTLIQKARNLGKRAVGGSAMLVWQAVDAHRIWDGDTYTQEEIQSIIEEMEEQINREYPLEKGADATQ